MSPSLVWATMTATIPGAPELPPPPPKPPTIAKRRELCGYNAPKMAPSCRHCTQQRYRGPSSGHHCGLHEFPVNLGGICGDFAAAG